MPETWDIAPELRALNREGDEPTPDLTCPECGRVVADGAMCVGGRTEPLGPIRVFHLPCSERRARRQFDEAVAEFRAYYRPMDAETLLCVLADFLPKGDASAQGCWRELLAKLKEGRA